MGSCENKLHVKRKKRILNDFSFIQILLIATRKYGCTRQRKHSNFKFDPKIGCFQRRFSKVFKQRWHCPAPDHGAENDQRTVFRTTSWKKEIYSALYSGTFSYQNPKFG